MRRPLTVTTVGYQTDFPYVNFRHECFNVNCRHPGAEVEFLLNSLRIINVSATVTPRSMSPKDIIENLHNGSADITHHTLVQSLDRMEKVDFTTPITFLYAGYFMREVPDLEVVDYILSSFNLPVVLLMVTSILTVSILLYFYTRLFNTSRWPFTRFLLKTFEGILNQFQFNLQGPLCVYVLAFAWIWFCFALILHYEATLRSSLTSSHCRGAKFDSLDGAMDAIEKEGWKLVIQEGSYNPFNFCKPVQCARLEKLKDRFVYIPFEEYLSNTLMQERHFAFTALSSDIAPNPISVVDSRMDILFVKDSIIAPQPLCYAVRKGIQEGFLSELNMAMRLSYSSFSTIRRRYSSEYPEYTHGHKHNDRTVLTLRHFHILFSVVIKTYIIAVLVFIGEILFHHGRKLKAPIRRGLHLARSFMLSKVSAAINEIELTTREQQTVN
ncbi:hypothetical protein Q1695_012025 [Nippostrongylus brasiliensis]|nr:hypothetical protein Q1695_012025 [Nippostrongylus brasiliensis]